MLPADLTAVELKYASRDVLAGRVAQLQAHLRRPCGECHPCDSHNALADPRPAVTVDHRVIMAFIQAPDEPDGDIGGPLRTAFRAAGIEVAE